MMVKSGGGGGGGDGKMISRFNGSETKKRDSFTPGFHLLNLKLLCALLSRKERRSGGKAVEERAPPRDRGGSRSSDSGCLDNEYVLPVLSGLMGIPISYKLERHHQNAINTERTGTRAFFFVHFSIGGRAPSESGQMANPQHGRGGTGVPN
jgi:hypothetical protein